MVDAALRPGTRKCHSRAPDAVQAVATACPGCGAARQRCTADPGPLHNSSRHAWCRACPRRDHAQIPEPFSELGRGSGRPFGHLPLSLSPVPRPRRSLSSGRATRGPVGGDKAPAGIQHFLPASEELGPPPSRRTTEIQTQAPPRRNRKIIGARIDLDVKRDLRRNKLIKAEHARSHHYSDSIELITSWKARHVSHLLPRNCVTEQCRRLRGESGGQRALVASCRASVCWNYFFLILARSQLARSFSLRAPAPSSNQIGSRAASSAVKS